MSPLPQDGGRPGDPAGGAHASRPSYWKRLEVWLLLLLLLGFILPWLQLGPFSTGSGLQIAGLPFLLDGVLGGFAAQSGQPSPEMGNLWTLHLLYLLPLAAIAALALAALRKSWRGMALLAGLMPWAALAYALTVDLEALAAEAGHQPPAGGVGLFDFLGVGAYLSMLAGLLVILRAVGVLGRR